jgi:type IV pilus assembly protein PilO
MHPIVENILERPLSHKVAIWIGTLIIVFACFWSLSIGGLLAERDEVSSRIEGLNAEISNERRLARNLDKFRKEVSELEQKLEVVLRQLPDQREIPDFLISIERKARESGLEDVSSFKPAGERFKEFYAEVPVPISVLGSYHEVATFFDEVGRLPRIVNVSDITLSQPSVREDGVRLKAECTLTTFRYLSEEERARLAAAAASKTDASKKRRR